MWKRVKKLYKNNKSKHVNNAFGDDVVSSDFENNNNNSNVNRKNTLNSQNTSQSCQNVSFLCDNIEDSVKMRKKPKKNEQKDATPLSKVDRKFISKSTSNLLKNSHQRLRPPSRSSSHVTTTRRRSSNSTSVSSLEALQESRLSLISQLDDYMDHVKRSCDDVSIAYAPNRLCCAQLLKTVLQRRQEQLIHESLHPNKTNPLSHTRRRRTKSSCLTPQNKSLSSSSMRHLQNPRTLDANSEHNLETISSEPIICPGSEAWKKGLDSESSSISDDFKNCNGVHFSKFRDSSYWGDEDDDDDVSNSEISSSRARTNSCCDSNGSVDYDSDNDTYDYDSNENSKRYARSKSIPLFPQHFDIY